MEKKVFHRSPSFIHFSRPLTLSKEQALLLQSEHLPALHVDVERVRVNNPEKPAGVLVGGVILFEKQETEGMFSMVSEGENSKGKEKEILPLKNGGWCTVPAFEFHNAFTLFREQELEIVEPAATGMLSIFADGKAKFDVELFELRNKNTNQK